MPTRRERLRRRAGDRCEYCHMPAVYTVLPHEVDHIKPLKHHGASALNNLAWACALCNSFKSSNVAGYDPTTGQLTRLYNPRIDGWAQNFRWDGPELTGTSPIGRATLDVLRINEAARVRHRQLLLIEGVHFV
jgi:hypothetical protein